LSSPATFVPTPPVFVPTLHALSAASGSTTYLLREGLDQIKWGWSNARNAICDSTEEKIVKYVLFKDCFCSSKASIIREAGKLWAHVAGKAGHMGLADTDTELPIPGHLHRLVRDAFPLYAALLGLTDR
jgi:hypothetical protein